MRFASSISAAAPETAVRKRLLQRWDCGTEEAELRWRLWADAAAKKSLRRERHREDERRQHGKMRGASIGRRQSTAIGKPQGTIGKPHGTIGKPHGAIGKLEITYAVRRMRRPLMPM